MPPEERRHGPSDVEWALLTAKVDAMQATVESLLIEFKKSNELAMTRCNNCINSNTIKDHEVRLRDMEKTIWKGVGAATIVASILSVAINHFLK